VKAEVIWGRHELGGIRDRAPSQRPIFSSPLRDNDSSSTRAFPFDITVNALTATFWPGTINSLLPSNAVAGISTGIAVPSTGVRYLVLTCTAASGAITNATFSADSSPPSSIAPLAGAPPTSFKILIGVTINAVPVKAWGDGNIQALPVEAFRTQKSSPAAGQVPYDIYYTWSMGLV
jgi:hypothetical protein